LERGSHRHLLDLQDLQCLLSHWSCCRDPSCVVTEVC
jgi:hypothetical protein